MKSLEEIKFDLSYKIFKRMKPYFKHTAEAELFVEKKYDDKIRSLIARKTRFIGKTYLNDFNYFVYSRGLPEYVVTDIMSEDVVCPIGIEDRKLLLFDDFNLWDNGELIGLLTPETRKRLRTSNK